MSADRYQVVLTGQLDEDRDEGKVRDALAALAKLPREKVDQLLAKAPVVIKRDLDAESAEKFRDAVEATGAVCDVKAEGAEVSAPAPAPASAPAAAPAADPDPEPQGQASVEQASADFDISKCRAGRGASWIGTGFRLFKRSPLIWIGVVVVWFVVFVVVSFVPFVGSIAVYLLQPIFVAGLMLGCRAIDDGEALEFNHLFMGFNVETGKLVGTGAVYLGGTIAILMVSVILTLALGGAVVSMDQLAAIAEGQPPDPAMIQALGFVFPLVAVVFFGLSLALIMGFWFAPVLVVFHGIGVMEAYKLSFRACLRNWLAFLVYGIMILLLSLLIGITFGLALLVIGPALLGSLYASYKEIFLGDTSETPAY